MLTFSAVYLTLRDGAQLQEAVRAAGSAMHGLLRSMLLLRLRLDPGGQGTL
jgi:hypothetical protein